MVTYNQLSSEFLPYTPNSHCHILLPVFRKRHHESVDSLCKNQEHYILSLFYHSPGFFSPSIGTWMKKVRSKTSY